MHRRQHQHLCTVLIENHFDAAAVAAVAPVAAAAAETRRIRAQAVQLSRAQAEQFTASSFLTLTLSVTY